MTVTTIGREDSEWTKSSRASCDRIERADPEQRLDVHMPSERTDLPDFLFRSIQSVLFGLSYLTRNSTFSKIVQSPTHLNRCASNMVSWLVRCFQLARADQCMLRPPLVYNRSSTNMDRRSESSVAMTVLRVNSHQVSTLEDTT